MQPRSRAGTPDPLRRISGMTIQKQPDPLRRISGITQKQQNDNIVFTWQNLCKRLTIETPASEIRQYAKVFGIPPQYWNNPRKMCELMTPRVSDYLQNVACDNDDENTMEGDLMNNVPPFLKYVFVDPRTGKRYCYSLLDLHKSIEANQQYDPYRRFPLTEDVRTDIQERIDFLRRAIEPKGLGERIFGTIQETIASMVPGQHMRFKLTDTWVKLSYPKYTIEDVWNADQSVLNGILIALDKQEGINVSNQEKHNFQSASDLSKKRDALIDVMYRIANIDDHSRSNLVALELAINESTPSDNTVPIDADAVIPMDFDSDSDSDDDSLDRYVDDNDVDLENFNSRKFYPAGYRILRDNTVWEAKENHYRGQPWILENWEPLGPPFSPDREYHADDIIHRRWTSHVAVFDNGPGYYNDFHWAEVRRPRRRR